MKLMLLSIVFICSCSMMIGKDSPKSAKGSLYTIPFSSPGWVYKKDKRSDYIFENDKDGRILLSNSFCEEFQDQPLEQLATKTFKTMKNFKVKGQKYTTFQDREAYLMEGTGIVDGVNVNLRLLNTRRNNCYFDFLAISPEGTDSTDSVFYDFLKSVVFK